MKYQIVSERQIYNDAIIKTSDDVYEIVKRYRNEEKKHFIVITLNNNHNPISVVIASIGLVNKTIVHPREVFIRAIQDLASAIIVCHNHPSDLLTIMPMIFCNVCFRLMNEVLLLSAADVHVSNPQGRPVIEWLNF